MDRLSTTLLAVAIGGWVVAGIAHVRGRRAAEEAERSAWATRRNQFLLLSSFSMNSLVVVTGYRYAKKFL